MLWQVHPTTQLYSPGGSTGLTVWLQFAIECFGSGLDLPNLSFPWVVMDPDQMQCVTEPHKCTSQMASKSVEQFKQGARM